MIEAIMYFGIGFLSATLIAISIVPLIHSRAVRLTRRQVENAMPQSMAEIIAEKDLQRAEFAVSTRRLEMTLEKLRENNTSQLAEIGRKDVIINRFKVDRQAHQVEMLLLKGEAGTLKEQLCATANKVDITQSRVDEIAMTGVMPIAALRCNAETVPSPALRSGSSAGPVSTEGSALNHERDHDAASLVPMAASATLADDSIRGSAVPDRNPGREVGVIARSNLSIHVSPADHFALERPGQGTARTAIALLAALIGVSGFCWAYYGGTYTSIVSWTQAIVAMGPTIATKAPPPEEKPFGPVPAQQLADPSEAPKAVEQLAATQAESSSSPAPIRSEQPKETLLSRTPQPQVRLVPVPETPPTTMSGWIVREVANGRAVVQGPNGVWSVGRGDTLPGAGRVDSIVRWGNRWVVATSKGLISTP